MLTRIKRTRQLLLGQQPFADQGLTESHSHTAQPGKCLVERLFRQNTLPHKYIRERWSSHSPCHNLLVTQSHYTAPAI